MPKPSSHSPHQDQQRDFVQRVRPLLIQASQALRRQQIESARQALRRALQAAPKCAEAWRMLGILELKTGNGVEAISRFQSAVGFAPDNAMAQMGLGIAQHDYGDVDIALTAFERACELAPESAACWFNLGKALRSRDDVGVRTCEVLQRALACDPEHVSARLTLADVLISVGATDAAVEHYRKILIREPANGDAWWGLASFAVGSLTAEDVDELQILSEHAGYTSDSGIRLGFALARSLESHGQYQDAFDILTKVNAGKRRTLDWDAGVERAYVKATTEAFARSDHDSVRSADRDRGMIFVVSLPRSGSTLVEQILASHSDVAGGGEMLDLPEILEEESSRRGQTFPHWASKASQADWVRLGDEYLQRTERLRSGKRYLTDKNLLTWRSVGAVARMLPGARFINIRRDRLETCLACYRQLFRTGMNFAYAFDDMVDYFRGYDTLCELWRNLYPRRFVDVEYEALISDPENEIRRLLAFCELPFEAACMDFHHTQRVIRTASAAQVRQKLRKDTARAEGYGDALEPLRQLLGRPKSV